MVFCGFVLHLSIVVLEPSEFELAQQREWRAWVMVADNTSVGSDSNCLRGQRT